MGWVRSHIASRRAVVGGGICGYLVNVNRWRNVAAKKVSRVKYGTENDRCYFVVVGRRRGPKKHSKPLALARFRVRGLVAAH